MTPLRRRMTEDMQMRNLSPNTQKAYLRAVAQLAQHYKRSPDQLGTEQVRAYLVHLINERHASPSLYNQARCALKLFFQVTLERPWALDRLVCQKTAKRLPVVLSREEVAQFLGAIRTLKYRALFMTICTFRKKLTRRAFGPSRSRRKNGSPATIAVLTQRCRKQESQGWRNGNCPSN
jgi:integrase/recombinase XerD